MANLIGTHYLPFSERQALARDFLFVQDESLRSYEAKKPKPLNWMGRTADFILFAKNSPLANILIKIAIIAVSITIVGLLLTLPLNWEAKRQLQESECIQARVGLIKGILGLTKKEFAQIPIVNLPQRVYLDIDPLIDFYPDHAHIIKGATVGQFPFIAMKEQNGSHFVIFPPIFHNGYWAIKKDRITHGIIDPNDAFKLAEQNRELAPLARAAIERI